MLKQMIKDEIKERVFGVEEMDKQTRVAFYVAMMLLLFLSVFSYSSQIVITAHNSYIPAAMISNR
jgi:predicted histidine transporter YuiF (NhaC family)